MCEVLQQLRQEGLIGVQLDLATLMVANQDVVVSGDKLSQPLLL
jgi:hypothetical protein